MTRPQRALAIVGGLTIIPLSVALAFSAGDEPGGRSPDASLRGAARGSAAISPKSPRVSAPNYVEGPMVGKPKAITRVPPPAPRTSPAVAGDDDYGVVAEAADPPERMPDPDVVQRFANPDLSVMARAKPAENASR